MIYKNALSLSELNQLLEYYQTQPEIHNEPNVVNKNLEYHRPIDFSYKILNPVVAGILGPDHEFDTGAYKECLQPYILHSDSHEQHAEYGTVTSFATTQKHNLAMLIPLVDGPEFSTVTFDIYSKQDITTKRLSMPNNLVKEDFGHDNFDTINHLPVSEIYNWQRGDVFTWDRQQYHISTNFARYGVVKKFLILFMA